jgi:hypothetical protein
MSESGDFVHSIAIEAGLSEVDLVVRAAWFLRTTSRQTNIPLDQAVGFLKEWSIRPNINVSRLKVKLRQSRQVSFQANGMLHIPTNTMRQLDQSYIQLLKIPPPEIHDNVLQVGDFVSSRAYVSELVRQINGAHQFGLFDCCAVIMRRLAEVLIIDAYTSKGEDHLIRDHDDNLKMMNGLINALKSGQTFKLSRNSPKYLEDLKTLGDTAAHSRNYITKRKDIDDFAQKFRMLIEELKNLN